MKDVTEMEIEISTIADLPAILELINMEYDFPYNTEAYWRWRYFENPIADATVYIVRGEGEQLAAMRTVSAYPMRINKQVEPAHLFTAVITHPDYRRKGLFRKLVTRATNDLEHPKGFFAYTFPNELSVQGYRRFSNWQQRETLSLWIRPIISTSWLKPTSASKHESGTLLSVPMEHKTDLDLKSVSHFDTETTPLLQRAFSHSAAFIGRDRAYLEWRYAKNPIANYNIEMALRLDEIAGYIVIKTSQFYGLWAALVVDLVAESNQVAQLLLKRALHIARSNHLQVMAYLVGHFNPYWKALLNSGFLHLPQRLSPRHFYLFTYPLETVDNPLASLVARMPWYVTWGDNDIV